MSEPHSGESVFRAQCLNTHVAKSKGAPLSFRLLWKAEGTDTDWLDQLIHLERGL